MSRRRLIRIITYLIVLGILSALGVSVSQTGQLDLPKTAAPPGMVRVTDASDGDTIKVMQAGKEETVRLVGIDTPETHDPRVSVQCFGQAASDKTKSLVIGKAVRLEPDPQSSDRDKYRRLLRYVYLEDGRLLNQVLVEEGYAFAYTLFPNSKLEQFRGWELAARQQNRGLWAGCNIDEAQQKKQTTSKR